MRSKGTWVFLFYVVSTLLAATVFTLATRELFGVFRVFDTPVLGQNFALSNLVGFALALIVLIYCAFLNQRARDFIEQCVEELHKVAWPSWPETRKSTYTVIVVSLVAALILGFFDSIFGWLSSHDFFLG